MAIEEARMQQKRGLLADFDPSQLIAGEIAVTIDSNTPDQHIYYCITPGVVKRLGTYDDFNQAISDYLATYISQMEGYVSDTQTSATNAATSETNASNSASSASTSATNASTSETNALTYSNNSASSATLSESWAIGGTGTRTGEDTNNSKYYSDEAKNAVSALTNAVVDMGELTFANIPTSNNSQGYMYTITDSFTTDSRFRIGTGVYFQAYAKIIYTNDGKWDAFVGSVSEYLKSNGDSLNNTTTFSVASTETSIASGDTHATLFGKILKKHNLIGTIGSLTTVATTIVGGINEIVSNIGSLSSLTTDVKTSIVNAINWLYGALIAGVAPKWVSGTTYKKGQCVYYNGAYYKCTTGNSDTTFTIGNWTVSNVCNSKQNKEWVNAGSASSTTVFNFPTDVDINEIWVIVSNGTQRADFYFPYAWLSGLGTSYRQFVRGHYYYPNQPIQSSSFALNINATSLAIAFTSYGSSDTTAASSAAIYIR